MNNQNQTSLLDRLVGQDGLKTDLRIRLQVPDDFYVKLGATVTLVGLALMIVYFGGKTLLGDE
jgi:hypothetical protein